MSTAASTAPTVGAARPDSRPASDARFAATGTLIRLVVRRDRLRLPIWVLACVFTVVSVFRSYEQLFPTAADRASLQASMSAAPSLALLFGRPGDLGMAGPYTVWRGGWFAALLMAMFAVLTVVRHTREEEDTGRAELVVSGVVGRYAMLTAALGVVLAASLLTGVLVSLSMIAGGAAAAGSIAFGAALALTGAVFAGVGAVAAQVGSFARTANGIGLAVVGGAYLLRGWGDAGDVPALSWISPLGWTNEVRPYTANRLWVLAIQAAACAALVAVAGVLGRRRDLGLGLVAPREGRAYAAPSLRGVAGLTYRLHRGTLAGWGVGFILTAIVFGSLAPSVANAFGDNTQLRDIIERMGGSADSLSVQFVASLCPMFGVAAALYGVQAMLRPHTEEVQGRLEPLLATPAPRLRWYAGHLVAALAGTTVLMLAAGIALASTAVVGLPAHTVGFGDVLAGALVQLPAVWVLVGVAAALVGALPRHTVLAWVLTGIVLAIGWIGPAINLSESVMRLSPFEHVPKLPGGAVHAGPLVVLLLIAAALIAVGAAGMRQRDVD